MSRLLEIKDLQVAFPSRQGPLLGVKSVTMHVGERERLGVVGESGSGKSVTALAILGLVQAPGEVTNGEVLWRGRNMLSPKIGAEVRGREIAMIFQDPMVSLNPLMTVGRQVGEVLKRKGYGDRAARRARGRELLELVGIPAPEERLKQFPHELSGGMRQRVMIAIALAAEPDLLIADEPTTALDVTIQAQILELLRKLSDELGVAVMMITHDLGVVAEFCDRVQVMYAGRVVERGTVEDLFADPLHPYSRGLLACSPRVDRSAAKLHSIPGDPPAHADAVSGCAFSNRCAEATDACHADEPPLLQISERRWVACWNRFDASTTNEAEVIGA